MMSLLSVLIANHNSTFFSPAKGVLQGSVLSPHLYSLYINSLTSLLRSAATVAGRFTLLRAYRPDATRPDPTLYFVLQEHILDL